jgi:hypothetical protein
MDKYIRAECEDCRYCELRSFSTAYVKGRQAEGVYVYGCKAEGCVEEKPPVKRQLQQAAKEILTD